MTRWCLRLRLWPLLGSIPKIDANRVLVNQLPPKKCRDGNKRPGQHAKINAPRPDYRFGPILETQQPIQSGQRQQHDSQCSVRPGCYQTANLRHRYQVHQSGGSRHSPTECANAGEPEPGPRPEGIAADQVSHIRSKQAQQGCNREVNQRGMEWMPPDSCAAHDGLEGYVSGHNRSPLVSGSTADRPIPGCQSNFSLPVFFLLFTMPLLTGCQGPLSMLDPAGPGALDATLLWWGIFGFFTVVYIGVVVAWLVALKKRSSP